MGHLAEINLLKHQLEEGLKAHKQAEVILNQTQAELQIIRNRILQVQPEADLLLLEEEPGKRYLNLHAPLNNTGILLTVEQVFKNIPYDIVLFSPQHRYLFLNDAAIRDPVLKEWMIGKTEEEYCNKIGKDKDEISASLAHFQSVLVNKLLLEWEERMPDGRGGWLYFLRKLQPLIDEHGQVIAVIGFGLNMFEKIKASAQSTRTERLYKDLYFKSLALICTHDMNGKLLSVNPATCILMQYTEKELVGRYIYEFMPENRRDEFFNVYLAAIRNEVIKQGVLCILSKSGEKLYLLIQSFRVEEEGLNTFIIGFSQDITERIKAEKKVLDAKKLTEESARAKETFLANLSHEIRTPMNGILGIAGLLGKTALNEQQDNFLKLIQDSANNLLAIVNDVLDLEKIIIGKLQFESIPFNIVDKVALTVQSFIYRAEEKGVAIITDYNIPNTLSVMGDSFRLSQILNNFLSNALKFTERGRITVTTGVQINERHIAEISFSIKDTGIGISKEIMAILFQPFVQAHAGISRKYGGTGLGLGICKNLIEMQGGTLTVESEEGIGSTFAFTLPYAISEEEDARTEMSPAVDFLSLGKKKVLVAEDVELNQFIAKHIMESWGFEVALASNGRQAINMILQEDFDIVLMDVEMPEMDGITATRKIRILKDHEKANVRIIALTANALKNDSENYLAAGMNDYISKPFSENNLFQVIARNLVSHPKNNPTSMKLNHKAKEVEASSAQDAKLYDLSMIISVSGGDEDFVKKMIALFIETAPVNLVELNTALNNKNWDMVSKTAHKLKSTLGSMGIHSLTQDVRIIESTAKKSESLENIPDLVQRVNRVINACIKQLESELVISA